MRQKRVFAKELATNSDFQRKLKMFALSDADAQIREGSITRAIDQTIEISNLVYNQGNRRAFSGASVTAGNLDGSTIYAAVMKSYVNSIVPIFAVQRNMDTPKQQLMYVDFYDVIDNKLIVPNIGHDKAWLNKSWDSKGANPVTEVLNPASAYTVTAGTPIMPRTFRAEIYKDNDLKGEIIDNGNGGFMATPGLLDGTTPSSIVYSNGGASTVTLNWITGLDANKIKYTVIFDQTNDDKVNRAFGKSEYYNMATEPLLVPVERNVVNDHAMAKQGIINNDELYANFIENEYTKALNNKVFRELTSNFSGDTYNADLSGFSLAAGNVDSLTRALKHAFVQGENIIAEQTYKEAKTTGILAGHDVVDMLNLLTPEQGWVKNTNRSYYKDIVGWLDEAPVVLCADGLAADEAMLTNRTADGQIAPLFHGIFLAPTDLPVVGNYANMTQYTSGLYSMEGMGYTSSKLCTKLKFKTPANLKITK